jgi:Capsular polysaccharide synthesis protein
MKSCLLLLLPCSLSLAVDAAKRSVAVYSTMPPKEKASVARKQKLDWEQISTPKDDLSISYLSKSEQRDFLQKHECPNAVKVFDQLQANVPMQSEIYKWCALATTSADVAIWMDSACPIINMKAVQKIVSNPYNVAVVDESTNSTHGSYIQLQVTKESKEFASKMLQLIVTAELDHLQSRALLIPQTTYKFISRVDSNMMDWYELTLSCRKGTAQEQMASQNHLACPTGVYCCSIQDTKAEQTLLLSRHFVLPYQVLPPLDELPKPVQGRRAAMEQDVPFISTIAVKELDAPAQRDTPNFYDMLAKDNCLPLHDDCSKCLRDKGGATCSTCKSHCACYCERLCQTEIPEKAIVQEWTVTPPRYAKHPTRLIPRIIHQTWFEEMDEENYPNMSRFLESFKQSGWEHRFYTDDDIVAFLQLHFPPAVLDAYQAIIPGAFKADLFRYCVLLIHGGVYADVDIHLESALDFSIPPDVGFMVPVDEPGKPVARQMCVWNGFIAAAPSHPFLAKAIETIVNQVRNRFTSVDIDATFCPDPELSMLHAYDTLFTAGPCMLGSSINRVLGRNAQSSHVPGELLGLWNGPQRDVTKQGTSFVKTVEGPRYVEQRIPGRTVILHQNKWDMGAHRFTFLEQNLVVAATDLPDSNDREANIELDNEENSENEEVKQQHLHYSKAHSKTGIYGLQHLYHDRVIANEEIRIVIDATLFSKKQIEVVV